MEAVEICAPNDLTRRINTAHRNASRSRESPIQLPTAKTSSARTKSQVPLGLGTEDCVQSWRVRHRLASSSRKTVIEISSKIHAFQ